ncbi:glycosyltransferase family 2 protein [Lentibacter sp.]|uniref:glycosyltransferase family 2 protein n=1 Tax=Lentibacter sp. TaxID=2024994 RepID=UPI003F6C3E31
MSLALIIPVRDDQANLTRLLTQAKTLGIFAQIIVVDDGSEAPVNVPDPVELLRHSVSKGAGAARNSAIAHLRCDHVIFFDSDDMFTPEFPCLWAELEGRLFDFCIFRHHDSGLEASGYSGQLPSDTGLWQLAGSLSAPLKTVTPEAHWILAETSNYPWNKIYRTAFIHAHGLRCTETTVHNDIELHWRSFLAADTVLSSSRIAALHTTAPEGARISNTKSRARLEMFVALESLRLAFEAAPEQSIGQLAFLRFCSNLFLWAESMVTADILPELRSRAAKFIAASLAPATYEKLVKTDPKLALQLALQMQAEPKAEAIAC